MRAKNLALRVLSTAAMLSIVTSIAAPAFAATYYINDGSVDVNVSEAGIVTVKQGGETYADDLHSVVIRGGTRGETDDRVKADASPPRRKQTGATPPQGTRRKRPRARIPLGTLHRSRKPQPPGSAKRVLRSRSPPKRKRKKRSSRSSRSQPKRK